MRRVTPSQLRAYAAVVRLGSVKDAASELGVTDAAISGQVAALRKELHDQLFVRASSGLAFTPGGLRLATRAGELLGLQDRTIREVSEAGSGRRLLRLASSSLFAEYAAPGLIQLFTSRAADIDVELSEAPASRATGMVTARVVDVVIGPKLAVPGDEVVQRPFLRYQLVLVVGPGHPLADARPRTEAMREQTWLLGPSAADADSAARRMLRSFNVPESRQQIFQSHAAALEEAKRDNGVAVAVTFAVADDIRHGRLVQLSVRGGQLEGMWSALSLPNHALPPVASELLRFITTPRATQAMLHGAAATVGRFRPSVHVTLWS